MNEEANKVITSAAKGAAERFAKGISDKVPPIYSDLIQPGAREVGRGLADIVKILRIPLEIAVWTKESIAEWFVPTMEDKIKFILPENLTSAKISIAGPSLEAIKYLEEEIELRDMYANLIATSMDITKRQNAMPSYIEIIKNMNGNDAIILKYFVENEISTYIDVMIGNEISPEQMLDGTYISLILEELNISMPANGLNSILNLKRLGLIESPSTHTLFDDSYDKILAHDAIKQMFDNLKNNSWTIKSIHKKFYKMTELGRSFAAACLK